MKSIVIFDNSLQHFSDLKLYVRSEQYIAAISAIIKEDTAKFTQRQHY